MSHQIDQLVPNAKVARRLGVTTRTVFRWTAQPELNFPEPCLINNRRYYSEAAIDAWKESRKPGAASPPAFRPLEPMTTEGRQ